MNGGIADRIMRAFTFLIPVAFLAFGIATLVILATGNIQKIEKNPNMDMKTAKIVYAVLGTGLLLLGGWLMYCRIFGPVQR